MSPRIARFALLALALAGCLLMAVAEFSTLVEIKVITAVVFERSPGDQHGYALLIIAVIAAVMAYGAAIGRSAPAAVALVALALVAAAVTLLVDYPKLDDVGLYGERYEAAEANPRSGFYLETLGVALLLVSAVAMVVVRERGRRGPAEATEKQDAPAAAPRERP